MRAKALCPSFLSEEDCLSNLSRKIDVPACACSVLTGLTRSFNSLLIRKFIKINFLIETIVGNDDSDDEAAGAAAAAPAHCKVSEQKETANGLVDDECGEEAPAGYAGLCRLVCYCCCSCLLAHCYVLDDLRNRLPSNTRGVLNKLLCWEV